MFALRWQVLPKEPARGSGHARRGSGRTARSLHRAKIQKEVMVLQKCGPLHLRSCLAMMCSGFSVQAICWPGWFYCVLPGEAVHLALHE